MVSLDHKKLIVCSMNKTLCYQHVEETVMMLLTLLPLDKMTTISQTIYFYAFLRMKTFIFWLKFHCNLFLNVLLTVILHRVRWWLGAEYMTSHYLNQCSPNSLTHICGTSATYTRQWFRWALVQIMACRLFGAKPLSEPKLGYCQLDP